MTQVLYPKQHVTRIRLSMKGLFICVSLGVNLWIDQQNNLKTAVQTTDEASRTVVWYNCCETKSRCSSSTSILCTHSSNRDLASRNFSCCSSAYKRRKAGKLLSTGQRTIGAFLCVLISCSSWSMASCIVSVQKLQRVQNNAARIVLQASRRSHVNSLLQTLHWLPVEQRINYKLAVLTFKTQRTSSP